MIILITGGARSGKSNYAQNLALNMSNSPVYVATARDWGDDFTERIQHHKNNRGKEWMSYEEEFEVSKLPIQETTAVIDCITLWLTNFFIKNQNNIDTALIEFKKEIIAIHQMPGTFIIVSNEIGMGVHAETAIGRKFTDLQGWANQFVASLADKVILMVSGIPVIIKETNQ
ncbi:bifunctional adenosylcobinamide kinase/adenosylcobinamide-phosphate guanylyltransferase [Hydrotalea sp.]|uniref:bifunctional adenosylcobinamide kinase/adenosylcobinamide-phosphate guanylyltransferase n=1 Tax=Hydrotalea sp. TaxID=2881279 RepID=UPI003D0F3CD2